MSRSSIWHALYFRLHNYLRNGFRIRQRVYFRDDINKTTWLCSPLCMRTYLRAYVALNAFYLQLASLTNSMYTIYRYTCACSFINMDIESTYILPVDCITHYTWSCNNADLFIYYNLCVCGKKKFVALLKKTAVPSVYILFFSEWYSFFLYIDLFSILIMIINILFKFPRNCDI